MELLNKVRKTIKKYSMLTDSDCVLLGLSGGPDSVCLAVILDKFKNDFGLSLNAVYIDHGLRPDETEKERMFCENLCEKLKFIFFHKSVDVKKYAKDAKLSLQEAARELRYQMYEEVSGEINATKIALGHTADDQAETFLMRLLRGGGARGLSSIPPIRSLEFSPCFRRDQSLESGIKKNISIIRPLIEIEKKEIEEFLAVNCSLYEPWLFTDNSSLPFIVDSSNLKTDYFRNWIRQKIMPELKKQNPSLIKTIGRVADIFREEDKYLELVSTGTFEKLVNRRGGGIIELFLIPLKNMERPILRRVLRRAIKEIKGLRSIDFIHIEDIIDLVKNGKSGDSLNLPGDIKVIKRYSTLMLTVKSPAKLKERIFDPSHEEVLEEAGIILRAEVLEKCNMNFNSKNIAIFDFNKLRFPLKVRMRQKGDYFYPANFGMRKKLQDFFVDEKIPRDKRDKIPLIVSENDIIWVAGYRADERFKVTDRTEKILKLIITKAIQELRD